MTKPSTIDEYLAGLPDDRRKALTSLREVILQNLPEGFEEGIQYGMIGYYVPLSRYPKTYNGQPLAYIGLASQKNYMSLYLMGCYGAEQHAAWFREAYLATGKKLDMGKSCVRFKKVENLPMDVIAQAVGLMSVEEVIETYEKSRQ